MEKIGTKTITPTEDRMYIRAHAAQHIGSRETQEDSFALELKEGLFAVADGLGGHNAGEVASAMAVDVCVAEVRGGNSLAEAVRVANKKIWQAAQKNSNWRHMGTTFTALQLYQSHFCWVHIGDSRLYRLRRGGVMVQMSTDHAYFDPFEQSNLLYTALGLHQDTDGLEISSKYLCHVKEGDQFLLCTDGLNVVPEEKIEHILKFYGGQVAADWLIKLVLDKKAPRQDNITVVVIEVLSL